MKTNVLNNFTVRSKLMPRLRSSFTSGPMMKINGWWRPRGRAREQRITLHHHFRPGVVRVEPRRAPTVVERT